MASRSLTFILAILLAVKAGPQASAHERVRPQTLADLSFKTERTQVHYRVPGALIAWANYPALRRDYPVLRSFTDAEIDRWILKQFAYISELQLGLRGIRSSPFEIDPTDHKIFTHPGAYYRAAVTAVSLPTGEALMDLKGSGMSDEVMVKGQRERFAKAIESGSTHAIDELRVEGHNDGLLSLGEGLAEITRQTAVQVAFDIHNHVHSTAFETIENYFLIDLGIDILKKNGESIPASLLGRQPHWRGRKADRTPESIFIDPYGDLQSSVFHTNVDFGGAIITEPLLQQTFGSFDAKKPTNPQHGNAWRYAHETARYFHDMVKQNPGHTSLARAAVTAHVEKMWEPLAEKYRALPSLSEAEREHQYLIWRLPLAEGRAFDSLLAHFLQLKPGTAAQQLDFFLSLGLPHRTFDRIAEYLARINEKRACSELLNKPASN